MAKYRNRLPQLEERLFLTDGGIETTLIFHEGLELPDFAAFHLLKDPAGREALRRYYARHVAIAKREGLGFVLESPTWRASANWGARLGYDRELLATANRDGIRLMRELRDAYETGSSPMVVSGCVGPRGDGYDSGTIMTEAEAEDYHREQIAVFAAADADFVTAITMTNVPEAVGVARAARAEGLPVVISFTLDTDGRLPTGEALGEAVRAVDQATGSAPAYYMINCAHPSHFAAVLADGGPWVERIRGIRANASKRSHQELNDAPDLDEGDPAELGRDYAALIKRHRWLTVLGGCCGTDHRHVERIALECQAVTA